MFTIKLFYI